VVISGAAASGAAASGAAALGATASGADCGTEAFGGGVRNSGSPVVDEGGSGVARIGEDGPGGDNEGGVRGGGNVMDDCCWGGGTD
jgi:hypothetical protein